MSSVEVHNITVSYNRKPVLWDVDFILPESKLIGIIGPNGSGKTTLLKAIMGLVPLSSGYSKIFDKPLDKVRQKVSYVPQRESVDWDFPASVRDVVLMGRYKRSNIFKRLSGLDKDLTDEALVKVKMQDFSNRQISQLSGGQQQRVFIARSLAQQAQLYLMDEPFGGVDAATENAILERLTSMKNNGKTAIVVHHDLRTAYEYFDWIIMLNTRLVACGPGKEVFTFENLQEAYGGQLNTFSRISEMIRQKDFPVRERQFSDK